MDTERATQLYAVLETGANAAERLEAALSVAPITSLLIVPSAGAALEAGSTKPLVEAAQRVGVAVLIAGDAQLARILRADGVHLGVDRDRMAAYEAAREVLGPRGIVGVDVGISRHDAMTIAEAGADYVGFGAPAHLKDRDKARERRDGLVAWWAEIFEVPCVAFDVDTVLEAEAQVRAGADFVGVRLPADATADAVRALLTDIVAATAAPPAAG